MNKQNSEVMRTAREGKHPILPFEAETLRTQCKTYSTDRKNLLRSGTGACGGLGRDLGDDGWGYSGELALKQDAECSGFLAEQKKRTAYDSVIFMPTGTDKEVGLGSLCAIEIHAPSGEILDWYSVFFTGRVVTLPDYITELLPPQGDCSVVTFESPVGQAIFGTTLGGTVRMQGGDNLVKVVRIESPLADFYADQQQLA